MSICKAIKPAGALTLALALSSASVGYTADKVEVCHTTGAGTQVALQVSSNSAHVAHNDPAAEIWYADEDGDGLGDPDASSAVCGDSHEGLVQNADDPDDTVPNTNTAPVCSSITWTGFAVAYPEISDADGDALTIVIVPGPFFANVPEPGAVGFDDGDCEEYPQLTTSFYVTDGTASSAICEATYICTN